MKARILSVKHCLFLLILTYPINYKLFLTFRITDFILMWTILLFIIYYKFDLTIYVILFMLFLLFFVISNIVSAFRFSVFNIENLLFLYKYCLPFIIIYIFTRTVKDKEELVFYIKISNIIFILMALYVYFFLFLSTTGFFPFGMRPAFPFTDVWTRKASDAHLYSAYLSNSLLFYIISFKVLGKKSIFNYIVLVITIGALLLTGSRNGILTIILTLFLYFFYLNLKNINNLNTKIRKGMLFIIVFMTFLIIAVVLNIEKFSFYEDFIILVERALAFNFFNGDTSSNVRITNLTESINLSLESCLLGIGITNTESSWLDGGISHLLVSSGFWGVLVFISIIMILICNTYIKSNNLDSFMFVFLLILNYTVSNLISEFFLITRSIVPFAINLSIMINLSKLEENGNRRSNGSDKIISN